MPTVKVGKKVKKFPYSEAGKKKAKKAVKKGGKMVTKKKK